MHGMLSATFIILAVCRGRIASVYTAFKVIRGGRMTDYCTQHVGTSDQDTAAEPSSTTLNCRRSTPAIAPLSFPACRLKVRARAITRGRGGGGGGWGGGVGSSRLISWQEVAFSPIGKPYLI